MNFETVFDVAEVGYKNWQFASVGLYLAIAGGIFVAFPGLARFIFPLGGMQPYPWSRSFFVSFFLFAVIWTAAVFGLTYGEYVQARDALASGRYNVAEGIVTDFNPYSGHADESFVVAGQKFSYSDYRVTAGFNNTRAHGGPIESGIHVRVTYTGSTILRIEIARDAAGDTFFSTPPLNWLPKQ